MLRSVGKWNECEQWPLVNCLMAILREKDSVQCGRVKPRKTSTWLRLDGRRMLVGSKNMEAGNTWDCGLPKMVVMSQGNNLFDGKSYWEHSGAIEPVEGYKDTPARRVTSRSSSAAAIPSGDPDSREWTTVLGVRRGVFLDALKFNQMQPET